MTAPRAMIERAVAPRPAWRITAELGLGTLIGSLPVGYAATADQAIAAWRLLHPHAPRATYTAREVTR